MADWGAVPGGAEPWREWAGCGERPQPQRRGFGEPGGRGLAGRRMRPSGVREATRGVHGRGVREVGPDPLPASPG